MKRARRDRTRRELKELAVKSELNQASLAKVEGGSFLNVLNKVGKTAESIATTAGKQAIKGAVQ